MEMRGKVAKIEFFEFWKTAIFRQTMDKNRGQSVHLKKDRHIVIELNSIFSQFLTQNFVFVLIFAGQEGQKLSQFPGVAKIETNTLTNESEGFHEKAKTQVHVLRAKLPGMSALPGSRVCLPSDPLLRRIQKKEAKAVPKLGSCN